MSSSIKEGFVDNEIKMSYVTQNAAQQAAISRQAENYDHQTSSSSSEAAAAAAAAAVEAAVEAATVNGMDVASSLLEQNIWPNTSSQPPASTTYHTQHIVHPLDSTTLMLNSWDPNSFSTSSNLKAEDWDLGAIHAATTAQQHHQPSFLDSAAPTSSVGNSIKDTTHYTLAATSNTASNIMPQTPPTATSAHFPTGIAANNVAAALLDSLNNFSYSSAPASIANTAISTPTSNGLVTPPMKNYFGTPTPRQQQQVQHKKIASTASAPYHMSRRCSSVEAGKYMQQQPSSTGGGGGAGTGGGRRASSHPSVASVVSLTAHEPVSKIIDGIEYITFLYSHDRLVKEYTVRTDFDYVNMNDIPMDFRIQNAIYPRANVDRSEYDGNRWDYETTCNQLGWKLCWLNKEQLFGRRGLIQRAVDSYRNRHAEMRSRRVTRQEKVANGTLRKRRSKKSLSTNTNAHAHLL